MNKNKEKVAKYFTNFVIGPGISNDEFPTCRNYIYCNVFPCYCEIIMHFPICVFTILLITRSEKQPSNLVFPVSDILDFFAYEWSKVTLASSLCISKV